MDTLLFHGCRPDAATNIQAEGLLLKYGGNHGSKLGAGIYGGSDPRKAVTYVDPAHPITLAMGKFLFVCRFNVSKATSVTGKHPKYTVNHEYCVPDEHHVVVLWMLKLA